MKGKEEDGGGGRRFQRKRGRCGRAEKRLTTKYTTTYFDTFDVAFFVRLVSRRNHRISLTRQVY
jgi:hypothetical protein